MRIEDEKLNDRVKFDRPFFVGGLCSCCQCGSDLTDTVIVLTAKDYYFTVNVNKTDEELKLKGKIKMEETVIVQILFIKRQQAIVYLLQH